MPGDWGVKVTLETSEGETFTEYGTSSLGTRIARQDRVVTTKVEAMTDQKFGFRIEAKGPFLNFDTRAPQPTRNIFGPPPYSLLMSILIDGKPLDRNIFVELLPNLPVMINGRLISTWHLPSGANDKGEQLFRPYDWVFTDVGIDVRLAQLGLLDHVGDDDENLQDSNAGVPQNDAAGDNSKRGTIEVRLRRFIIEREKSGLFMAGPTRTDESSENLSPESLDRVGPNVTHQVELVSEDSTETTKEMVGGYYPDRFDSYAIFKFQYMSRSKLVNLGLANEDGSKVTAAQRSARQQEMALAEAAASSNRKSKRKASEEDETMETTMPTSESKRSTSDKSQPAAGRPMAMPLRLKANNNQRWLRSSAQQEAAKMLE